jgi:hypothetical protein
MERCRCREEGGGGSQAGGKEGGKEDEAKWRGRREWLATLSKSYDHDCWTDTAIHCSEVGVSGGGGENESA